MIAFALQALLGAIGPQALPREGCAAYLWNLAEPPQLVAMAEPGRLRIQLDGKPLDLARTAAEGAVALGLASRTVYAAADVTVTVEMKVVERPELAKGGLASEATLTVQRGSGDAVVLPVGGMIGCR